MESAVTAIDGDWLSKKTCCTALVPWCSALLEPERAAASVSSAVSVKSSGMVPSIAADGRGRLKVYWFGLPPAAPACAHAPVSPAMRRQTLEAATPAPSVMVPCTLSGEAPPAK